jgi:pimeloyl-ACP methyl ester carboxylesterase
MRTTLHMFDWRAGERADHAGFGTISAPVTLFYGDQDHFVVDQGAQRYANVVPGIQVTLIPGCGHVVPQEAPEAMVEAARGRPVTFHY